MSELAAGTGLGKPGDGPLDLAFAAKVAAVLNDPYVFMEFLQQHKEHLVQFLALNMPAIPITSVFGFTGFTPQPATQINTEESTTSTSYTDLATEGPELTGLPDGNYVFDFGALGRNSGAGGSYASLSVNGAAASDDNSIITGTTTDVSLSRSVVLELSNDGNNSVKVVYQASAGTATFNYRWLVGYRYSNL